MDCLEAINNKQIAATKNNVQIENIARINSLIDRICLIEET